MQLKSFAAMPDNTIMRNTKTVTDKIKLKHVAVLTTNMNKQPKLIP